MKLKDWFKAMKQKREQKKRQKAGYAPERTAPQLQPLDADTTGIEQPESRFTEEYREFVKKQAAKGPAGQTRCEEK